MAATTTCSHRVVSHGRQCSNQRCIRDGQITEFCGIHYVPPDEHRCVCAISNGQRCTKETVGVIDMEWSNDLETRLHQVDIFGSSRLFSVTGTISEMNVCTRHFNNNFTLSDRDIHRSIPVETRQAIIDQHNVARDLVARDEKRLVQRDNRGRLCDVQKPHGDAMAWYRLGQLPPTPYEHPMSRENTWWTSMDSSVPVFQVRVPHNRPPPPTAPPPPEMTMGDPEKEVECAVCYDTYTGDRCIVLPCRHSFCALCTVKIRNRVCPMCRSMY